MWTNHSYTAFFTDAEQIALSVNQRAALAAAGVELPLDLVEIRSTEDWKSIQDIARKYVIPPVARQPRRNAEQPAGNLPTYAPLGIRSIKRMKVVSDALNYYILVGREPSPTAVHYTNRLIRFSKQVDALKLEVKNNKEPIKCTPNMSTMKWVKHFREDLNETFTSDDIPIPYSYILRKDVAVGPIEDLRPIECFSTTYTSIQEELSHRHLHTNPTFRRDNAKVFSFIDAATAGVPKLNASLASHRRTRDGRSAWMQLLRQHCGKAKWEDVVEASRAVIYESTYTATNPNHTLELYTSTRRDAWNAWIDAAHHITTQVPLEKELVRTYLKGINCSDAEVCAAVAVIKAKADHGNLLYNFEDAAAYLIPTCPVTKKKKTKASSVQISSVNVGCNTPASVIWKDEVTSNGVKLKKPFGKTGVYLGWIPKDEFRLLTPEQHAERKAFGETEEGRTLSQKEHSIRKKRRNPVRPNAAKKVKIEPNEASVAAASASVASTFQEQIQIANMISQAQSLPPPPQVTTVPPPSYVSTGSTLTPSHVPYNQAMATAASIQAIMRQAQPNQSTK